MGSVAFVGLRLLALLLIVATTCFISYLAHHLHNSPEHEHRQLHTHSRHRLLYNHHHLAGYHNRHRHAQIHPWTSAAPPPPPADNVSSAANAQAEVGSRQPSPPPLSSPPPPSPPLPAPPALAGHSPAGLRTLEALKALTDRIRAERGEVVLLTFANSAFRELLLNWVAGVRRAGVEHFLVGAMDPEMARLCEARGLPFHPLSDAGLLDRIEKNEEVTPLNDLGAKDFREDNKAFRNMGARKAGFALALLELGHPVLVSDVDVAVLRDPRPFFARPAARSAHLWVSSDCLSVAGDRQLDGPSPAREAGEPKWWRRGAAPFSAEVNGNPIDAPFNTGVVYFSTAPQSAQFLQQWQQTIVHGGANMGHEVWDDQEAFNLVARLGPGGPPHFAEPLTFAPGGGGRVIKVMNRKVHLGILPVDTFANGHVFFVQRRHEAPGARQPFLVHNTFNHQGPEGKLTRFRHQSLWHTDPPEYWREGNFLTWDSTPPPALRRELEALYVPWAAAEGAGTGPYLASHMRLMAFHLLSLRNALALAETLGRTLILPTFECHCDRFWYPIINTCRTPGAELPAPFACTADMLFPVALWRTEARGTALERTRWPPFLEDPRLAPAIRNSTQTIRVVPRDQLSDQMEGALPEHASDEEAARRLQRFAGVRVLRLSSAADAFCTFLDRRRAADFDLRMERQLVNKWCCTMEPHPAGGGLIPDPPPPLANTTFDPATRRCSRRGRAGFPVVEWAQQLEANCRENEKCQKWNKLG